MVNYMSRHYCGCALLIGFKVPFLQSHGSQSTVACTDTGNGKLVGGYSLSYRRNEVILGCLMVCGGTPGYLSEVLWIDYKGLIIIAILPA